MLASLHVKNLALIEEEEIYFSKGLNILTGETGAGKSIILGALHLCLGDKASKEILRNNCDEAFVEAVFLVSDEKTKEALKELDITCYDDEVILTRKITESRSTCKINGEQVPANIMQKAGFLLIDIYGQKEHLSLINKNKHLEMLDEFARDDIGELKLELADLYKQYCFVKTELSKVTKDDSAKAREMDLLSHEINEISEARLSANEDLQLEEEYKHMENFQKIMEGMLRAHQATANDGGVSDLLSVAISSMKSIEAYDDKAEGLISMLTDAEAIVFDFNHEISAYVDDSIFDEARFNEITLRLNEINRLKDKYGRTIEEILNVLEQKEAELEKLKSYDEYIEGLQQKFSILEKQLEDLSTRLSEIRKRNALRLCSNVSEVMKDLNFLSCDFMMDFARTDAYSANGFDDCQFMISTNPGEPLKPLKDIASGGEMSRIMLAIKTVLADSDELDTLIFDEIDAGISGITASMVARKLDIIAKEHQVICITHLPQIAALASSHYLIEKNVVEGMTVSAIRKLDKDDSIKELARMLGGDNITDAVMESARQLKELN